MKLSVLMITYNHERYIAQALDSALMQQTPFDFEIVVAEDKSPDSTRDIVQDYARRDSRIRPLLREKNFGMAPNFIDAFHSCKGDYIALLEGDDYWTDPQKLRIQVEALDSHPDWATTFHPVSELSDRDSVPSGLRRPFPEKIVYDLTDIVRRNFVMTCSAVFRNKLFPEFPDWIRTLPMLDWPLHVLNARSGKIGFIDRVMGVYRQHAGGVWSRMSSVEHYQQTLRVLRLFEQHVLPGRPDVFHPIYAELAGTLTLKYLQAGDRPAARKEFRQYLRLGGWRRPGIRSLLPTLFFQLYLRPGAKSAG